MRNLNFSKFGRNFSANEPEPTLNPTPTTTVDS